MHSNFNNIFFVDSFMKEVRHDCPETPDLYDVDFPNNLYYPYETVQRLGYYFCRRCRYGLPKILFEIHDGVFRVNCVFDIRPYIRRNNYEDY